MHKNKFEYKVLKISSMLALAGLAVFLPLIALNYSWSIGWLVGCTSSFIGYLIGILLINKFFKKEKSKSLGFWVGMARFYINLAFQGLLFIAVVAIDKSVSDHSFMGGSMADMDSPINLYTYLGGVSIIFIGTLVAQFLSRKEG